MKAMMLTLLLAAFISATTRVCAEQPAPGPGSAEDDQAIRGVIAAVFESANRHDTKAGAALFTEDADFVNVLGMWWKGSAEIERSWKARFETGLRTATFKPLDVQVSFLKPDVAIAHVTSEITGFVGPDGKPTEPHRERSLRVLIKQDGKWLVRAFHNTTVASSVPAAK